MNAADAPGFAADWIAAWNRRDMEAVLAHYADDARFTSPRAKLVVGEGTLHGKAALRDYWGKSLTRIGRLVFTLDRVLWDDAARTIVVTYVGERDAAKTRCVEIMRFDASGRVVEGEALYGADV